MPFLHKLLTPPLKAILTRMSRRRLPSPQGEMVIPGLQAPVTIHYDRWGVPHIEAQSPRDLFFAQGYAHARERMFQMDIARRLATGRLSERFGEMALDTDRMVRTFGFRRIAQAEWEACEAPLRDVLQAYAAGVNAYLDNPSEALEVAFSLLRYRPDPWEPLDSLSIIRLMVWELSHGWQGELVRAELIAAVGPERAADWEPHYPADNPVNLPEGIVFNRLDPDGRLRRAEGPFLARGQGSNVWAVSAARSATGGAVLANDMHLKASVPGVWYENHLRAGDFHVTGVSIAGVPLVLVGHNAHLGWGMTLAYTDAEDLFVERFDPQHPRRYLFRGQWREAELVTEEIMVKGRAEPVVEEVLITHHGPVISPVTSYGPALQSEGEFREGLAVCSMALRPGKALRGWWLLNQATDWDAFVTALRWIDAPQLVTGYADTEGNIGFWVTGKHPLRGRGDGRVPVPGWTGEYDWVGEVPFEAAPHAFNPRQGFFVNTNNKIVPDDYPYFLGDIWMNGYRARRLEQIITGKARLSLEDHAAAQVDVTCLPGQEFVAALRDSQPAEADAALALQLLRAWDFRLTPESVGGAVYEVSRYTLVRNLLLAGVDEAVAYRVMGQGFHPLTLYASEFFGHDIVVLLRMLRSPENWWVQQAGGREAWLTRSLSAAVGWLRQRLGPEPQGWQWGRLHRLPLEHLLSSQPPLDAIFNLPSHPVGGDPDTPMQTSYFPQAPYDAANFAPSHRQIFDLTDWDNARIVILPGQSGRLASPHYADQLPLWLAGEHHPMLWSAEAVRAHLEGTLHLQPPQP